GRAAAGLRGRAYSVIDALRPITGRGRGGLFSVPKITYPACPAPTPPANSENLAWYWLDPLRSEPIDRLSAPVRTGATRCARPRASRISPAPSRPTCRVGSNSDAIAAEFTRERRPTRPPPQRR